jgi:transposase
MMGSQRGAQEQLFYSFSLDDHVPKDHLLRGIDRFLDLSELCVQLAAFYSHTGRPSIDPVLMIRMLVIGYSFGILGAPPLRGGAPEPGVSLVLPPWAERASA